MDKYGQIGPEKGDYATDVRAVARKLLQGPVQVKLTHRLTAMRLVLLWERDCAQHGADGEEGLIPQLFVAVVEHGAYWFRMVGFLAPSYVQQKLGITLADAETVAEFLVRLSGQGVQLKEVVDGGD